MKLNSWLKQVADAYKLAGKPYTKLVEKFLVSADAVKSEESLQVGENVGEILMLYVFHKAELGETFGSVHRVKDTFGKSLEEHYGLQSGPFIDVAKAYWTFKMEVGDLFPEHKDKNITQLLAIIENDIGAFFFPTPGPITIPVIKRRKVQQELLQRYAPQIDIERFLEESPILRVGSGGCLSVAIASITIPIAIISALIFLYNAT